MQYLYFTGCNITQPTAIGLGKRVPGENYGNAHGHLNKTGPTPLNQIYGTDPMIFVR